MTKPANVRKKYPYQRAKRHSPPGTWNTTNVIHALKDWTELTGNPPSMANWVAKQSRTKPHKLHQPTTPANHLWIKEYPRWPSHSTVKKLFGTWSNGLQAAGLPTRGRTFTTTIIERIHHAERLYAQGKTQKEIAAIIDVSITTVKTYLNTKPCPECNGPVVSPHAQRCNTCAKLNRPKTAWTKHEVIQRIHEWHRTYGTLPKVEDWGGIIPKEGSIWEQNSPYWPPAGTIQILFKSWNNAIIAAGYRPAHYAWTKHEVIQAFQNFATQHGRPPKLAESLKNKQLPSQPTVTKYFKNWNNAIIAAGYRPAIRGAPWTKHEALQALQTWKTQHGRYPKSTEIETSGGWHIPNKSNLRRLFGSYTEAIKQAQQTEL